MYGNRPNYKLMQQKHAVMSTSEDIDRTQGL